ncbi:unnamed protein product [Lactuca saligna]|uniref:Uncharacterized protein n=1 Tax=Lactuca saligna TaxID=75948 RepID=A0AA35VCG3_LACSI|nr:unnamed protein product [Lactuca saligna]
MSPTDVSTYSLPSQPVLRAHSPSGRFYTSSSSNSFASSTSIFSPSSSSFFQNRSTSPTRVNVYRSSPSASNIRFSLVNRQISPSRSISVIPRSNNSNQALKKKMDKPRRMCMYLPTSLPGKLFNEMPGDEFWSEIKAIRWYHVSVDPPFTGLPWLVLDNTLTCIQFNPIDDRYFISGSIDAKLHILSIPNRQVANWNDLHEMVTVACYTPDGQLESQDSGMSRDDAYEGSWSELSNRTIDETLPSVTRVALSPFPGRSKRDNELLVLEFGEPRLIWVVGIPGDVSVQGFKMARGSHVGRISRISYEIRDIWSGLVFIKKIIECYVGRTGYSIKRINDPFKHGYRTGYGDLWCGHMRPGLLVDETRCKER